MDVIAAIRETSTSLAGLVERKVRDLELACRQAGISPVNAKLVVMWGGGKDSTLALLISCSLCQELGCSLRAVTMAHPGLTRATIGNIQSLVNVLEIQHEWRRFRRVVASVDPSDKEWICLYRRLAVATGLHPRFMCVGCNLGSTVTEFQALVDNRATFRITGNPLRELQEFDRWAVDLKREFAEGVSYPPETGQPLVDYYRVWWAIYHALLKELESLKNSSALTDCQESADAGYLYELPNEGCWIQNTRVLPVLEDDVSAYFPENYEGVLRAFGWRLPDDIVGGTESDCAMPVAIAALDIQQQGLLVYIEHLNQAAGALSPLPEMYSRAVSWANNGRSVTEGRELLARLGIPVDTCEDIRGTPIALALARQLLPVR